MKSRAACAWMLCGLLVALVACRKPVATEETPAADGENQRHEKETLLAAGEGVRDKDYPHLHNLTQLTQRFYSGAEPHGEEAFAELQKLGIRTVVSVDGARPDIETAKKYGIDYVHIPIGYDGVPEEAGLALARLARQADEPVYVHCHHGRHRGPAAAAVACVAAGATDGKGALSILERAGTSKGYAGLWRDVEKYQPPADDAQLPELVEVAEVGSMAAAMAKIDRAKDNLKLSQQAKWSVPPDHPDIVPTQEALILKEALHETGRNLSGDYDDEFTVRLKESEEIAIALEAALNNNRPQAASQHFERMLQSCKACHVKYRD